MKLFIFKRKSYLMLMAKYWCMKNKGKPLKNMEKKTNFFEKNLTKIVEKNRILCYK
jgi:hypothetical protein